MKDEKEKLEILEFLREVTTQTNVQQLLRDLNANPSNFYTGRYSLERMMEVKTELKRRLKELSQK